MSRVVLWLPSMMCRNDAQARHTYQISSGTIVEHTTDSVKSLHVIFVEILITEAGHAHKASELGTHADALITRA